MTSHYITKIGDVLSVEDFSKKIADTRFIIPGEDGVHFWVNSASIPFSYNREDVLKILRHMLSPESDVSRINATGEGPADLKADCTEKWIRDGKHAWKRIA